MIRREIKSKEYPDISWPHTPEELTKLLQDGPMRELYNVIFATIKGNFSLSQPLATEIWSLASDWEALLSTFVAPKQVLTGMTIHRLTGRKEVSVLLHKMNNAISYNEIRIQNKAWVHMLASVPEISKYMMKHTSTHVTIDNNDGQEETVTGEGTSHDTNRDGEWVPVTIQIEQYFSHY